MTMTETSSITISLILSGQILFCNAHVTKREKKQ